MNLLCHFSDFLHFVVSYHLNVNLVAALCTLINVQQIGYFTKPFVLLCKIDFRACIFLKICLFLDFSSSVQADKSTANYVLYLISTVADWIDFAECAFLWGEVKGSAI